MTVTLALVPYQHVLPIWGLVRDFIKNAMDRGVICNDFAITERDVLTGRCSLWVIVDSDKILAAAVTEKNDNIFTIVALGGVDMDRWFHFLPEIENHARNSGCNTVRILGRPGWRRVLHDYKCRAVVLERGL